MAAETDGQAMVKIHEPFADPALNMMHLGRDIAADMALEMFAQKFKT